MNSNISLRGCVQIFDDAMSPDFCQQMLHAFHALARFHRSNGKGVRPGHEHSAWTELDFTALCEAPFRQMLLAQMHHFAQQYNQRLGLTLQIPATDQLDQLVIKRYRPQPAEQPAEAFQLHFDAIGQVANRYLVFLWYLNDVQEGGETVFPDLALRIAPKTGRLLMFPPYWMFQHEGLPPISGDKYIFSTYYLFR